LTRASARCRRVFPLAATLRVMVGLIPLGGACEVPEYQPRSAPLGTTLCGPVSPGMACIPGGTFEMGTDDDAFVAAKPIHAVTVDAFLMSLTETTVAQYRACVEAGACRMIDGDNTGSGDVCAYLTSGSDDYPVDCVDWDDAKSFCTWSGRRLPTEEEWEYAAQRPDGRSYPWGDRAPDGPLLNACGQECRGDGFPWNDGYPGTAPVGSFPNGRTIDGLLDLAGNAWEWTASRACDYPVGPCRVCDLTDPGCVQPCGVCGSQNIIMRGGGDNASWSTDYRVVERGIFNPNNRWTAAGFRCAH
jgi:formylglycine-generating enzyme required for sulfatase activity